MDPITLALAKKYTEESLLGAGALKGEKGEDGSDYVLTEADKQEIAELAAELVPSGGGGASEWKTAMEYNAITEDIGTLTVDVPNATEIEVYIVGRAQNSDNSATDNTADFDVKLNNNTVGRFSMYVRGPGSNYARYIKLTSGNAGVSVTKSENSSESYATFAPVVRNDNRSVTMPINTFSIVPVTSGMLIKAGSKIGIRYR